jgi:hypothetical protein
LKGRNALQCGGINGRGKKWGWRVVTRVKSVSCKQAKCVAKEWSQKTAVEEGRWCSKDGRCRLDKVRIVVEKCWVFKRKGRRKWVFGQNRKRGKECQK